MGEWTHSTAPDGSQSQEDPTVGGKLGATVEHQMVTDDPQGLSVEVTFF